MPIMLERVAGKLPLGFAELEADANADGHRHMTRLAIEFAESTAVFHAIFACSLNGRVSGIGAITDEPAWNCYSMWRMRRLYVHREFRRRGVARTIATALPQEAAEFVSTVTVHAGNDDAVRFWEAIGFHPVVDCPWSHEINTSR